MADMTDELEKRLEQEHANFRLLAELERNAEDGASAMIAVRRIRVAEVLLTEALQALRDRKAEIEGLRKALAPRAIKYDVERAKRDHARGDSSYLIELASLADYERQCAKTWHLIAKAMGYETGGRWDEPAAELGVLRQQVERQRARVRSALSTQGEQS